MKLRQNGWSLMETLVAIVVLGIGITAFMRIQSRASGSSKANSNLYHAGQIIEKHVESMRIQISQNPAVYWPPRDTSFIDTVYNSIKLDRKISDAVSPKDGAVLATVRKVDLTVSWGTNALDSIKVTTYVSKSF